MGESWELVPKREVGLLKYASMCLVLLMIVFPPHYDLHSQATSHILSIPVRYIRAGRSNNITVFQLEADCSQGINQNCFTQCSYSGKP